VDLSWLSAFQNARIVKNAEEYYRVSADGTTSSWNLRDHHMADSIEDEATYLRREPAKVVVWAHNSHQGDARATDMGARGEWNVGQLMRRRYGMGAVLVGFTTFGGTVFAADEWGREGRVRKVNESIRGSFGRLFHETGLPAFLLSFRGAPSLAALLDRPMQQRAIGVIYRPATERVSHYFEARLPQQFDAVVHIDATRAITPLP
jgi:erythromycin esterase-like protein